MVRVKAVGYKYRDPIVFQQLNPVSGTKYEVLATTQKVMILQIEIHVTWTVQPTPLEVHITVDGVSISCPQNNPASATIYYATLIRAASGGAMQNETMARQGGHGVLEGRNIKIEFETTGGTVSSLDGVVKYAVLRP